MKMPKRKQSSNSNGKKVNCSMFYGHIGLLSVRDGHWVGLIALTFFVPKTCVTLQCSSFYGRMSLRLFFVGIPLLQHLSPFPLLFWDIFGSLFSTRKHCASLNPYLWSRSQPSQNAINRQQHHILAIIQHQGLRKIVPLGNILQRDATLCLERL